MVWPGTSEKDMNNWDQLTTKNGVPSWFNNKQIYVLVWILNITWKSICWRLYYIYYIIFPFFLGDVKNYDIY